tara:strand:+ start:846794 stop:847054 length:261 start_codon:yes stop_codon:yes gene_type:complete
MHAEHGPLLQGSALYQALGYNTYAAFHRARQRGEIGVHIFPIAGRRGIFALTEEVALWVIKQADLVEDGAVTDSQEKKEEQSAPHA